jgi:ABC-type microcin C transport system permease subunit YejE
MWPAWRVLFRRGGRGFWPAAVLAILFVVTMPAEFIANDRPLAVSYVGYLYFPVLHDYPETVFGGDFETNADFTDAYLSFRIQRHGWVLWPLIPFSDASPVIDLPKPSPTPPSNRNWLGTDSRQRDVFARLIYSVRRSLLLALSIFAICGGVRVLVRREMVALFYLPAIAVAAIATLDFAGQGFVNERLSLGAMAREGLTNAPWLLISAVFALMILLIPLIVLGRALGRVRRDV